MRVEAFTNRRLSSLYEGYRPGDPLELCYEADRPDLEGLEPEEAAQAVFGELNRDDRPNPTFPALSVGDVVSYRTRSGEAGALAVGSSASGRCGRTPPRRTATGPPTAGSSRRGTNGGAEEAAAVRIIPRG